MAVVTRVFKSGNSAAVRLPRELAVAVGTELEIERDGEVIHLRPVRRKIDVSAFAGKLPGLRQLAPDEREIEPSRIDWSAFDGKFGRRDPLP